MKSAKRTDAQSDAVRFWTQANWGRLVPSRHAGVGPQRASARRERPPIRVAVDGLANCFIVDWDAKFQYNFWRPVTAIRNGDRTATMPPSATRAGCR